MTNTILTMTLLAGGLTLFAAPVDPKVIGAPSTAIERLSEEARTPSQHLEAAKQLRAYAKSLEVKADKLEAEVKEQRSAPVAMNQKWPALMNASVEKKERLVVQSRRAAREAYAKAERHERMAAGDTATADSND